MIESPINRVIIPGSFDLFSRDHRRFLDTCITTASYEMEIDNVTIGLVPDKLLSKKGKYRPFFPYTWRQEDITKWYKSINIPQPLEFEEFYPGRLLHSPPTEPRYKLALLSTEHRNTTIAEATAMLAEKIVYAPPVDTTHTSDIERTLQETRDTSYCNWRVGAVLLRNGSVVSSHHNGGAKPDSCKSCSKGIDVQRALETSGKYQPSPVDCDYPHAEMQAIAEAQEGDYLLTTLSPCVGCAEAIINSGIERVVYLRHYHTTQEPIQLLAINNVKIRQAGYHPVNTFT